MADIINTVTTDGLKSYALWLSGEPTDGSSDYDDRVVQHMQMVYDTLVNGGTLGTRDVATSAGLYEHLVDIPTTDWIWLRQYPVFAFTTTSAIVGSTASVTANGPTPITLGTVSLTLGSPNISFSVAPPVSVTGWRLKLQQQAAGIPNPPITVPRIKQHSAGATTATLDTPWPQETQSTSAFVLFLIEYPLPTNFIRFCEEPSVHGGWSGQSPPRLAVGSAGQVETQFPIQDVNQGPPTEAARIAAGVIQMNRWDTQSYRIEFSYIFNPDPLVVGISQEPAVPRRYRHVLSVGAAMLVALDKVDGRTGALSSQFREIVAHMGNEVRHEKMAGSTLMGRQLYRRGQFGRRRGILRSASGLPLW